MIELVCGLVLGFVIGHYFGYQKSRASEDKARIRKRLAIGTSKYA